MPFKRRDGGDPKASLTGLPARVKASTRDALLAIGALIEGETKRLLLTPGRGAIRAGGRDRKGTGSFRRVDGKMKRVGRGAAKTNIDLTNRASLPGDPPAPDTGTLARSITHELNAAGTSVRIGTNIEYAEPLENGTTTAGKSRNVRIAPRPFLRPAVAATRDQVDAIIRSTLSNAAGPR